MDKDELLEEGYLDLKVNQYIEGFRKRYSKEYLCIKKFDNFINKIQVELGKKGVLQQNAFIMASLTELQKLYDSAILLFERGIPESANVLIRTILDLSFKIIEVVRNKQFVEDLLLEEDYEKLATLNEIEIHKFYDMLPKERLKEIKSKIEEEINQRDRPRTKTIYLVNKNKLNREYILYRLQCEYTHQSASIIGSIIKQTEDEIYIDGDLQLENFKTSIAWLLSITIIPIEVILNEYIKSKEIIEEFNNILICFKEDLL